MAEDNPNHNDAHSAKPIISLNPSGGEPYQENLDVTGDDKIDKKKNNNNSGPEADDEENGKGEKNKHLDPKENESKVEENTSPDKNDHVSSPKSSAGGEKPTVNSSPDLDGKRRPEDSMNEIKTQETHCLYCSKCKSNITKDAKLFKKGLETDQYKTKPFIIWIPLLIPSFLLQLFCRNTPEPGKPSSEPGKPSSEPGKHSPETGTHSPVSVKASPESGKPSSETGTHSPELGKPSPDTVNANLPEGLWEKPKNFFLNWLTFLRFLLVVVLLLISSVIVLLVLRQNDDEDLSLPTPMYIKYLPVIASLFLAILAVPWRSIPVPYPDILRKYIVVPIQNLDIVKSIVYGGLIESITSLGVVSCAAGSGTSTLNVLALGIANLITGLILIIHKLYGLIANQPRSHNQNSDHHMTKSEREDLYEEMLGKPDKRKLHCVVVVVSFIFFGLIPPFFYGLSFKRNDEGLYKAAVVLAPSLGCVISLSFAKAYAFIMDKRWTVPVYTGMAVVASVLSFIASQFLSNLLEKYDFHEFASDYREG